MPYCACQYSHGDFNHDGLINIQDFVLFTKGGCYKHFTFGHPECEIYDLNHDGIVNITDYTTFVNLFNGHDHICHIELVEAVREADGTLTCPIFPVEPKHAYIEIKAYLDSNEINVEFQIDGVSRGQTPVKLEVSPNALITVTFMPFADEAGIHYLPEQENISVAVPQATTIPVSTSYKKVVEEEPGFEKWLPMSPFEGPPLPRYFGIKWPWVT